MKDPSAEAATRPLQWRLIVQLWRLMNDQRGRRNLLVGLVLLRSAQLPILAWIIAAVINGPITGGADLMVILWAALGMLAFAAFTQATLAWRQRLALEIGEQIVHDLRGDLFRHLQRMPMDYFARTKTGRVVSRMTSDCEAIRNGVQNVFFVSLVQIGQMIGAGLFMAYYDPLLFSVVLLIAPIVWLIGRLMRGRLGQAYREVQESFSRVTSTIAESVAIIRVTQAMAREETNSQMFRSLISDHARYNMNSARQSGAMLPMLELTGQISLALVIAVGAYRALVSQPPMPVGDLIQFWFLAGLFFSPISVLGTQFDAALSAMAGAERVFHILDSSPSWTDLPDSRPLPPSIRGDVRFDHVHFEYESGRSVLHDIDCSIPAGQSVALVGETGSGKSTLASLVARFYLPTAGRVLIDGIDTRDVTASSLTRYVAVVQQQNFLFSGTVLENLLAARPGATQADVLAAFDALDCRWVLDDLPEGLATQAGTRGGKISLGQRQLICFVRALIQNPRILILDEATSAIDSLTELRIQRALLKLLEGRTSIIIAHRLSTVVAADRICVLDHGRIVQSGTHLELLEQPGIYSRLYERFSQHEANVRL